MSALTNINPAVDFELDKSAELYDEIHSACEEAEEALRLYTEKFSFRSIETYMKERISFGEYLEYRQHVLEKNVHANPPVTADDVDALIEDMVELRESRGSNRNEAQAMAELRPFSTTRTDKSHAQIMRELMSGQKHLIRLNAAVLNRRHQPSKLLRRVSKVQHKIREKEEADAAIAAEYLAEAEKYEAAARAYDNDEVESDEEVKATEDKEEESSADKDDANIDVVDDPKESPGSGEKKKPSSKTLSFAQ